MSDNLNIDLANEPVELLADRALFWPRERTLFVADLHFGKSNTFQRLGVPLIDNTNSELDRLDAILSSTGSQRVVLLGDFIHSSLGTTTGLADTLNNWLSSHRSVHFELVKGNHDRGIDNTIKASNLAIIEHKLQVGPFVCRHEPGEDPQGYVLCGHLHPGFRLSERGGTSLHVACFWIRTRYCVLPAFGSFTGTKAVSSVKDDRVVLVGDGELKQIQ